MTSNVLAIEVEGLVKHFGQTKALRGVEAPRPARTQARQRATEPLEWFDLQYLSGAEPRTRERRSLDDLSPRQQRQGPSMEIPYTP